MPKVIPVYIGDRLIYKAPSTWRKSDVYNKFWRIYNISKIYRVYSPRDKFMVETGRVKQWVPL